MRHLNDGILRRLLDEPLAIADSQKRHLAMCQICSTRYARIEEDARDIRVTLDMPVFSPQLNAALERVNQRLDNRESRPSARHAQQWRRFQPTWRYAFWSAATACAVLTGVALTPAGSLAQSFVTIFQPKSVTAVQLSALDLRSLSQLRHYGAIRFPKRMQNQPAASAKDASSLSGMKVLVPPLGATGVPSTVHYTVSPGATASFTFSAAKAQAWATKTGKGLPTMSASIDGSTIGVTMGASVVGTYGSCASGCSAIPQLIIGQMVAPKISSTGANLKQLEDYVFSLPGVSPQLATELRSIGDPTSTLPIPVPSGFAHADSVQVQGVQGEAMGDNTGVGSLLVWEKDGVVYAVGGTVPLTQVESIANSLR